MNNEIRELIHELTPDELDLVSGGEIPQFLIEVGKEVLKAAVQEAESVVAPACGVLGVGNTSLNVRSNSATGS
jgi:hypothetical protein